MLVLSRKNGEEILIPSLGMTIRVMKTSSGRVKLGITAPNRVRVRRSEAVPQKTR